VRGSEVFYCWVYAVLTLIYSYNFVSSDFSPFSDVDTKLCTARLWMRKCKQNYTTTKASIFLQSLCMRLKSGSVNKSPIGVAMDLRKLRQNASLVRPINSSRLQPRCKMPWYGTANDAWI